MTTDDMELVREYASRQSESAFGTLVSRYTNLVYSAALRQARDSQLAEEITQVVFIILARKARTFDDRTVLPGWLYRTTRYVSKSALKRELRRQRREQEAYMQSTLNETTPAWERLSPLLDEAMARLGKTDRDALVLRFFEGRSLQEVGTMLGASEEAAKKRVNRATEKLQRYFSRRGVSSTTAIITGAISANSVQAAPVALAKSVTAAAMAKGAAASGSTLTLIKGAMKLMVWSNVKTAVILGASVLFAAGGGAAFYEAQSNAETSGAATGNDPVPMRIQWIVGKKYTAHMDLDQGTESTVAGLSQPVKSEVKWAQDFTISPLKELDAGGWQLELEFDNETIDVEQGGQHLMSFASAESTPADHDPLTPPVLHVKVGGRLEYFTDADGKVHRVEGVDEFKNRITVTGNAQQQAIFKQMFNEDFLKRFLSLGDVMPNQMVNIGRTWRAKKEINSSAGVLSSDLKYTFKNWQPMGGRKCAHIEDAGDISTKSVSTASGAAIEIESGNVSGDVWFDPELGMIAAEDSYQDMTLKVTTQAGTIRPHMTQNVRLTLLDVQ